MVSKQMVSMLRHIDKHKNQGVAVRHDKGVDFSVPIWGNIPVASIYGLLYLSV